MKFQLEITGLIISIDVPKIELGRIDFGFRVRHFQFEFHFIDDRISLGVFAFQDRRIPVSAHFKFRFLGDRFFRNCLFGKRFPRGRFIGGGWQRFASDGLLIVRRGFRFSLWNNHFLGDDLIAVGFHDGQCFEGGFWFRGGFRFCFWLGFVKVHFVFGGFRFRFDLGLRFLALSVFLDGGFLLTGLQIHGGTHAIALHDFGRITKPHDKLNPSQSQFAIGGNFVIGFGFQLVAVDESAVGTAQIPDGHAVLGDADFAMHSRDFRRGNPQTAFGAAPDNRIRFQQHLFDFGFFMSQFQPNFHMRIIEERIKKPTRIETIKYKPNTRTDDSEAKRILGPRRWIADVAGLEYILDVNNLVILLSMRINTCVCFRVSWRRAFLA